MKKIILSIVLLMILSVTCLASDTIKIGTPTVDGILDTTYQESYKIELNGREDTFYTSKGGVADGSIGDSAVAYYLYDDSYLYACITVTDEDLFSRGEGWIKKNIKELSWENDAVEIRVYYPELGDAVQENQYIFQCDAMGIATTNYKGMCEGEHICATTINADGYTVEFAVPLSFGKKAGDEIGLSVEVDDLQEAVTGVNTKMGGHKFNAYGSQHPYKNMVKLGSEKASKRTTVFDDTKNHWGKDYISYVMQASLFNGMGMGFEPDTAMTRAMFVTVLGRVYEKKTGTLTQYENAPRFTDADYNSWYGKYVGWASGAGVVNGVGNSLFAPDTPITREEMAVMLFRFAKAVPSDKEVEFSDFESVSDWAKDAVAYCVEKGYIAGDNNNCFLPRNNATRAEVSALITRYMKGAIVKLY